MMTSPKSGLMGPPPPPPAPEEVLLRVGERRFVTTKDTLLRGGPFFTTLLSGRRAARTHDDRALFIDADGDAFVHILAYLRHGLFPLLWNNTEGHDHAGYTAVLVQARRLGVTRLEKWLKDKSYIQVVRIEIEIIRHPKVYARRMGGDFSDIHSEFYTALQQPLRERVQGHAAADDSSDDEIDWKMLMIQRKTVIRDHLLVEQRET
jgi:hypothetical protein